MCVQPSYQISSVCLAVRPSLNRIRNSVTLHNTGTLTFWNPSRCWKSSSERQVFAAGAVKPIRLPNLPKQQWMRTLKTGLFVFWPVLSMVISVCLMARKWGRNTISMKKIIMWNFSHHKWHVRQMLWHELYKVSTCILILTQFSTNMSYFQTATNSVRFPFHCNINSYPNNLLTFYLQFLFITLKWYLENLFTLLTFLATHQAPILAPSLSYLQLLPIFSPCKTYQVWQNQDQSKKQKYRLDNLPHVRNCLRSITSGFRKTCAVIDHRLSTPQWFNIKGIHQMVTYTFVCNIYLI